MDNPFRKHSGRLRRMFTIAATALALGLTCLPARAQEEAAPAAPAEQGLDELVMIGLERQPALAAARASLAAAESGRRGLDTISFPARLLACDLPVRKQQACLGIGIAAAGLRQAEWETRYAITRNFYSIQYARTQLALIVTLQGKLEANRKKAIDLEKLGDPKIKVSQIDIDLLTLNIEFVKAKKAEASSGILKATAALREAMGVGLDYPLNVIAVWPPPEADKLNKNELIALALANRGEVDQATAALRVTELEVEAQCRLCLVPYAKTFASGADIHAKEIPQGVSNGEYRPGAIGLEMPPNLAGNRNARMERAQDLSNRASAVLDKTHNLITLEVEAYYLKWQEAAEKVRNLSAAHPKLTKGIVTKIENNFKEGSATAEELLRARALEDQTQAQLNEARYLEALGLAALERATAGGYRLPFPGKAP